MFVEFFKSIDFYADDDFVTVETLESFEDLLSRVYLILGAYVPFDSSK